MRIKILASALVVFAVLSVGFIPEAIISSLPKSSAVSPVIKSYRKIITVNGTIESKSIREVYIDTPVIADFVEVDIGSTVEKNQVLAVIDTNTTKNVLKNSIGVTGDFNRPDSALMDMANKYGISAETVMNAFESNISGLADETTYNIPSAILAPISGIVTDINISGGVLTQTSKPVMVISDNKNYRMKVSVSENNISQISLGDRVEITGVAFDEPYLGVVTKIYPVARKVSSGSSQETKVDVNIDIFGPFDSLKHGYSAKAEILAGEEREMITIPYEAVSQDDNNREYVCVYKNGKAEKSYVRTGTETMDGVEIVSGISMDDRLLLYPDKIKDGNYVLVK